MCFKKTISEILLTTCSDANDKKVIVTGGYSTDASNPNVDNVLFTTEYLDLSRYTDGWIQMNKAHDLPFPMRNVPMIDDPAKGAVYLVGASKSQ